MKKLQLSAILLLTLFASCSEDDQSINVDTLLKLKENRPQLPLSLKTILQLQTLNGHLIKGHT